MASYPTTIDIGKWDVEQGRTPGRVLGYTAVGPVRQHRRDRDDTQFTSLAQRVAGQDLSGFFNDRLYSHIKPPLP